MGLYVETRIRVELDDLWRRTQRPELHQRWDLRFGSIEYLPRESPDDPQRFRYATRLAPGLIIAGTGIAAGERWRPDGGCTSALRFGSHDPLCLLAQGRGYWRYVPDGDGVRFLTGYDYEPRWGRFGRLADRVLFRPLMAWATAWSFDRLRLWCEQGIPPERSLRQAWAETGIRCLAVALSIAWAVSAGTVLPLIIALAALAIPPLPTTPAARRTHFHPVRCRCRTGLTKE